MLKKTVSVFLCVLMCLGCAAAPAFASVTMRNMDLDRVQFIDDDRITGTVYISISEDGRFVTSNGNESDVVMAHVAVPLSELAFDLRDYGYGDYIYDLSAYDDEAAWRQPITLMHLFIYTMETYYEGGWNCNVTGNAGSTYVQNGFWGHDENLTYYVNGAYPLEDVNWGATSDHICLEDGDAADVQMYSNWSFWSDPKAGFHYFVNQNQSITYSYEAHADTPFSATIARAWGSMETGGQTNMAVEKNYPFWYGATLYNQKTATKTQTGKNIVFTKAGTYYLWADGAKGSVETNAVVSSPAYAKVTVSAHDFSKKTQTATYQKTAATCTEPAVYYYACSVCDAVGTKTYTAGEAAGHTAPNAEGKCDTCGVVLTETPVQSQELCPYCHQPHTGPFGSIIRFFHNLIYFFRNLFGNQ